MIFGGRSLKIRVTSTDVKHQNLLNYLTTGEQTMVEKKHVGLRMSCDQKIPGKQVKCDVCNASPRATATSDEVHD